MSITISTAAGAVELVEMFDGYGKGISRDGPFIEKKFLLDWAKADAAANAIMGINRSMSVLGTITRTLPLICPESPNLVAVGIGKIEGTGEYTVNDGTPTFEFALMTVSFGNPPYTMGGADASGNTFNNLDQNNFMSPDPGQSYDFCTFQYSFSSELITVPGTSYKYSSGSLSGKTIGRTWGIRLTNTTIKCTVHKVPWLPTDAIMTLQGCVNNAVFFSRPRGTVLFDGAETTIARAQDGTVLSVDIELTFKARSKPWNQVPQPNDGSTWIAVTHNGNPSIYDGGSGIPMYQEDDLRPLIFGVQF